MNGLLLAAAAGHEEVVALLLNRGAQINQSVFKLVELFKTGVVLEASALATFPESFSGGFAFSSDILFVACKHSIGASLSLLASSVTDEGVSALVVAYRGYRGLDVPGLVLKGGHSNPIRMERLYETVSNSCF